MNCLNILFGVIIILAGVIFLSSTLDISTKKIGVKEEKKVSCDDEFRYVLISLTAILGGIVILYRELF